MGALAQTGDKAVAVTKAEEEQQFLTFLLDREVFAIEILRVREILEYGGVTPVPMMPPCVRGVINLRGRVVPVVDLAVRFGRAPIEPGRRTCIVLVETVSGEGGQDIGVIVDAVNKVLEIPEKDIEPPPAFGSGLRLEFIRGMGKVDGQFVVLLDVDKTLSVIDITGIIAQQEATESPEAAP